MRHSKQTNDPDRDKKESQNHGRCKSDRKRKRRSSSGEVNKCCKRHLSELPESTCSEAKFLNQRHRHEQHYFEGHRNEYNQGHDIEHPSSKSSGHSGMSCYKRKYKTHHATCRRHHHHSESHRRKRSRSIERDEEGYLICQSGDILSARYEVVAVLGEGAFGRVVECIDHGAADRHVAVKIVRKGDQHAEAAHAEIKILEHLNTLDPSSTHHCVQMLDWFEHHGHVCIVFELLGLNTFDFIEENGFLPLRLDHIRHMAYQICQSVNFLHLNKLTHTDLKPDNIVFVSSDYREEYNPRLRCSERRLKNPDIKVVDFGNAIYDDEYHCTVVSTKYYRAPEVILALGWSQPCDVWSIGCILIEYYLGTALFPIRDSKEHLAMMEQILGPLPKNMIKKSKKHRYFHRGWLNWDKGSSGRRYTARRCKPLKELMTCHDSDHENFFDLLANMLEYDPAKRITLQEALNHPFFH